MIIIPTIDLRDGQVVCLLRGNPNAQTTYANDPAATAEAFATQGVEWLQVVNLNGAFGETEGAKKSLAATQAILDRVNIPVQVGGGVRTVEDIELLLNMGASRVILGTIIIDRPRQLVDIVARFGAKQLVASVDVDAEQGTIVTHGWRKDQVIDPIQLGQRLQTIGLTHIICTDINRDGAMTGANIALAEELACHSELQVILAGGVATISDIEQAKTAARGRIYGLAIGRAFYTGDIEVTAALAAAQATRNRSHHSF